MPFESSVMSPAESHTARMQKENNHAITNAP